MPNSNENSSKSKKRAKYEKPRAKTESLTAVAALCNGTAGGGRKGSTAAPSFCSSTKLKS